MMNKHVNQESDGKERQWMNEKNEWINKEKDEQIDEENEK